MSFYVKMQDLAERLIIKFGTDGTLQSIDNTPIDPLRPDKGNAGTLTPTDIKCVKLPLTESDNRYFTPDVIATASFKVLVSCKGLLVDIKQSDEINIEAVKYSVVASKLINPTNTTKVLYTVLVK